MREEWQDYEQRQKIEHELIDRKTNWLLATQGLLFASYGWIFKEAVSSGSSGGRFERLADIVAAVGAATALLILVGVLTLIVSKVVSFRDYRRFFDNPRHALPGPLSVRRLQLGVRTFNTCVGLIPDVFLPILFVYAWLVIRSH